MASSKVKLVYFAVRSRGELTRLVLAAGGKEYEDVRLDRECWFNKFKAESPFGQCPYMELDGKRYGQSMAIANFFAREFNLYGKTNLDALEIEQVEGLVLDLIVIRSRARRTPNPQEQVELTKKLEEEDYPRFVGFFEKLLAENGTGYFVGSALTVADIAVFDVLDFYVRDNPDCLKTHPHLAKNIENVKNSKCLAEYIKTRPPTDL